MPTNESKLVAQIQKKIAAAWPAAWIFKVVGSPYQMGGVPDLLVVVEGLAFGLEVKYPQPGESQEHAVGRASDLQKVQIMRLRRAGATADVVTSAEDALALIRERLDKDRGLEADPGR